VKTALVVGSGPAGLMAAEVLGQAGVRVTLAEAMTAPGRKLLMAGKSGLNLTKDEGAAAFLAAYPDPAPAMAAALRDFGPERVMEWARGLGQEVFTGSSGRVFPVAMKASPLLRAWLARLAGLGVDLRTRWTWTGGGRFDTPGGLVDLRADITILALGGASWARLGSNGAWAGLMTPGTVAPFVPVNGGLAVDWSPQMARHFGAPVKGVALGAGQLRTRGEFVIGRRGLEGGGIYAVERGVRAGSDLIVDLFPDLSPDRLAARILALPPRASITERLRRLGLSPAAAALALEFGRPLTDLTALKSLTVRHRGPRPLDEAISTGGGLRFAALDGFMLRHAPGIFAAGEMLDWEAPTGGYLISGCLASGRAAALQALSVAAALTPSE
jgi:hypothetical protein